METKTIVVKGPAVGRATEPIQIAAIGDRAVIGPSSPSKVRLEARFDLVAGLSQLLRAFDYATDVGRDIWDFAIELSELRNAGMTTSDLRWLVSKGFIQHGQETSMYGAPHRCFRRSDGLTFLSTSALVLTPRGATELRKLLAAAVPSGFVEASESSPASIHRLVVEPHGVQAAKKLVTRLLEDKETTATTACCLPLDLKPAWEARRRELRFGELLVKKFRVPAGNQELILSAFEEEGWPAYIDDPLPVKSEIVPKQRLHNAITRLNGSQLAPVLRFHGNGNGDAVGWQLLPVNTCL